MLIYTEGLSRYFQMGEETVHALDGLDVDIESGEFVAVMGPCGSGKSTLLYLLGGLDRPTDGRIWVEGRDIAALDENALAAYRMRDIGFIFQAFHLIPTMTALENVMFPMLFAQVPAERRQARATELLERVGLGERLHHKPTELSGGQQQRVAIARALANDPPLILADEPTGNLDSHSGAEIMRLLTHLHREEGRTVIIVSHDPTVTDYATRALHLRDGRIDGDMKKEYGVGSKGEI